MEYMIDFQLKGRYLINRFGTPIILISFLLFGYYIYSASFSEFNFTENIIFIFVVLSLLSIGIWCMSYNTFKRSKMTLIKQGFIFKSDIGFIPLHFNEVERFDSINIKDKNQKIQFVIVCNDGRKFKIRAHKDIYEGLIATFPSKEGSYTL